MLIEDRVPTTCPVLSTAMRYELLSFRSNIQTQELIRPVPHSLASTDAKYLLRSNKRLGGLAVPTGDQTHKKTVSSMKHAAPLLSTGLRYSIQLYSEICVREAHSLNMFDLKTRNLLHAAKSSNEGGVELTYPDWLESSAVLISAMMGT